MNEAIVYIRTKTDHMRLEEMNRFAAQMGISIVQVISETSKKRVLPHRVGFQRLLEQLHLTTTKSVLITNFVSFSRALREQESIFRYFTYCGWQLISLDGDPLERRSGGLMSVPIRTYVRDALDDFCALLNSTSTLRLRGSRSRIRREKGRCEGRKPYGSNGMEREVLERMRSLRATGLPFAKIAETLITEKVPSRSGRTWHPNTIRRILNRYT